jgi:hypothetical protein
MTVTSTLGNQITVPSIEIVGTPKTRSTFNQFDEHGLLVSLARLRGETNWEYKRRILDVFANKANASYRGLVNGITRELGLSLFDALLINPKTDPGTDAFLAPDPLIKFDGVWLYLYSDYTNEELSHKIDRYEPGGNYEHLQRIVDFVNQTAYFEANLVAGVNSFTRSMTVLNQTNREFVALEEVPVSTKFRLVNSRPVSGTVFFSNRTVFDAEVSTAAEVDRAGRYYIDYVTGIVTSYSMPDIGVSVRYWYTKYPFRAAASPVVLHDINSEEFKVKMFEQVLQDDGEYTHGLPTILGADVINELLSVYPMYYGA